MPDAVTGLMQNFGKIMPLFQLASGGMGTIGNILANKTRNDVLQQQMNLTRKYANLTPAQITAGIQGLERPLSAGLTQGVGNVVQGQLAERGLAQAPGIYATTLSQALAPYMLQEQQLATDAYFKQLGLPISSRPSPFGPFPESTNTSAIWNALMQRYGPQTPGITPPVSVVNQGPPLPPGYSPEGQDYWNSILFGGQMGGTGSPVFSFGGDTTGGLG